MTKQTSEIRHLLTYAFEKGFTVSVFDGEEWGVKRSTSIKECMDLINDLDESEIRIRDTDGKSVAWALLVPGNAHDEQVADYTANAWMARWSRAYRLHIGDTPFESEADIARMELEEAERRAAKQA